MNSYDLSLKYRAVVVVVVFFFFCGGGRGLVCFGVFFFLVLELTNHPRRPRGR